jgi:hypothetical protein
LYSVRVVEMETERLQEVVSVSETWKKATGVAADGDGAVQ